MHRLGLGPLEIRRAIGWFEAGKSPAFPLREKIRALRLRGARQQEARALFIRLLMEMALASGSVHQQERLVLWQVCTEFDVGRVELAQLEAILRAQRSFRRSAAGDADARRLTAAYRTLGIEKSASNDEIKRAYRRLMNRNHPDKLAGANPDRAAIAEAERRTREVRGAYDLLKARRSIR
jgi:DnaJ like chaperone protein